MSCKELVSPKKQNKTKIHQKNPKKNQTNKQKEKPKHRQFDKKH